MTDEPARERLGFARVRQHTCLRSHHRQMLTPPTATAGNRTQLAAE
jgi:hypothetical protein